MSQLSTVLEEHDYSYCAHISFCVIALTPSMVSVSNDVTYCVSIYCYLGQFLSPPVCVG